MTTIAKSFLSVANSSVFNKSEWKPVGDAYTLEEIWNVTNPGLYKQIDGDEAEITVTEFESGNDATRILVKFKTGDELELKGGKALAATFEEGDKVKVDLIYGQELRKLGQPSIIRYDVWESEEAKEAYLKERDAA